MRRGRSIGKLMSFPASADGSASTTAKVVFETLPEPGGMLRVGIPSYRLPLEVLMRETDLLQRLGIEIRLNSALGRDVTLESLKKDFDATFVAIGAHKPKLMAVKGEDLEGVFPGITFLKKTQPGRNRGGQG